jgi:PAS domain S-box-containing protein
MGAEPSPAKFSDADEAFLLLIASWIADELDRQESEEALRMSELKFRTFVETTRDWVWQVDEHTVYTYASPRIREILGYEPDEVIGKTPVDLMPPDKALRVADLFGPIAAARRPFTLLENTNRHKNGSLVVLETSGTPIFDSAGTFRGYHGIDRDITDRTRAAEALRLSELRLQRFVAEAPVGLCILDENWRTISANKALCTLTGYEEHELVGSSYALYTHPEDLAADVVLTDEFFRGVRSEYTCEKRYIRKSGEIIWVLVKATRIELSGHAGPLLLAAVQDITDRKLALEEREHLSRDLHDNILQALYAVGMQLEAGKLSIGKSSRRSKIHMTHAIDQLNGLMADVRRFIALLAQRPTAELNFGQAQRQLIASLSGADQSTPELDIKNPVLSFITPKLGEQLLNITREALSNSLRHARASHRWIRLSLEDNAIRLIIGDNGVGFSITRKRRGGHGLRNMAARAKDISGTFTLKSAPGQGTSILIDVPLKKGRVYE